MFAIYIVAFMSIIPFSSQQEDSLLCKQPMIDTLLCFKFHHGHEWRQAKVYQNLSLLLFLRDSHDLKFKWKRSLLYQTQSKLFRQLRSKTLEHQDNVKNFQEESLPLLGTKFFLKMEKSIDPDLAKLFSPIHISINFSTNIYNFPFIQLHLNG